MKTYEEAIGCEARIIAMDEKKADSGLLDEHEIMQRNNERYGFINAISIIYEVGMAKVIHDVQNALLSIKDGDK